MFKINEKNFTLTLHAGDTGSFDIRGIREDGAAWETGDIVRFTVANGAGEIIIDRAYKLTGVDGVPEGCAVIEFHNNDTDTWPAGGYTMQARFYVNPSWSNGAPAGDVTDLLAVGSYPNEGDIVDIPEGGDDKPSGIGAITVLRAYGEG